MVVIWEGLLPSLFNSFGSKDWGDRLSRKYEDIQYRHTKITGIYRIINIINNKVYIGSSFNLYTRKCNHVSQLKKNKHHSTHLQNSWNKYGENNFKFEILEIINFEDSNIDNDKILKEKEKYYIDLHNSSTITYGYNIAKEPERSPMYGRKHSEESRKKMSEWQKGENNNNFGKNFSLEHRKNMGIASSKSQKGKIIPQETRDKISKTLKDKNHTPSKEALEKAAISNSRRIAQYDLEGNFIKFWNSIASAAKFFETSHCNIMDCCKGRQKTSKGFIWKYTEEVGVVNE